MTNLMGPPGPRIAPAWADIGRPGDERVQAEDETGQPLRLRATPYGDLRPGDVLYEYDRDGDWWYPADITVVEVRRIERGWAYLTVRDCDGSGPYARLATDITWTAVQERGRSEQ